MIGFVECAIILVVINVFVLTCWTVSKITGLEKFNEEKKSVDVKVTEDLKGKICQLEITVSNLSEQLKTLRFEHEFDAMCLESIFEDLEEAHEKHSQEIASLQPALALSELNSAEIRIAQDDLAVCELQFREIREMLKSQRGPLSPSPNNEGSPSPFKLFARGKFNKVPVNTLSKDEKIELVESYRRNLFGTAWDKYTESAINQSREEIKSKLHLKNRVANHVRSIDISFSVVVLLNALNLAFEENLHPHEAKLAADHMFSETGMLDLFHPILWIEIKMHNGSVDDKEKKIQLFAAKTLAEKLRNIAKMDTGVAKMVYEFLNHSAISEEFMTRYEDYSSIENIFS